MLRPALWEHCVHNGVSVVSDLGGPNPSGGMFYLYMRLVNSGGIRWQFSAGNDADISSMQAMPACDSVALGIDIATYNMVVINWWVG